MQKLQIYTQTEAGPSIKFQITCEKCKYLEEKDDKDESNSYFVCSKLKRYIGEFSLITPFDCPLINIEKTNIVLNAIENYVKV